MSIAPIQPPVLPTGPEALGEIRGGELRDSGAIRGGGTPRVDLGNSFTKALDEARAAEHTATDSADKFAVGDPSVGIHEVVIASEKANIAIRYATTLKNKALEAYRELMNTQV
jgi:flagellar hook-basal body complex protein FliE